MNIGLFTDTYFPQINGVGASVHILAQELTKLGHQVYIFTPTDPRVSKQKEEHVIRMPSMPFIFIKGYRMGLIYPPHIIQKIAGLHLDIVHTQTEFSLGFFGKIFSKALNIPMIHTYHTMYEDYVHYIVNGAIVTPSMAHAFSKIFCNHANAVIAPTQKVKDSLLQYGVNKPMRIIPTGIVLDSFRKSNFSKEDTLALKECMGIDPTDPIILFIGRVGKEKSIDVILKAMPEIVQSLPKAKFLIIGDGPYKEELEKITVSLGIENNVIFAGFKPWAEIGKYYQLGDIFASASVSETQGLTFAEAMAAGIPVVIKKDPCTESYVIDGQTGIVFEKDEDFAKKAVMLLKDKQKQEELAQNAMQYVEQFSSQTFAKSVESFYTDIIQNPEAYGYQKDRSLTPIRLKRKFIHTMTILNQDIKKAPGVVKHMALRPIKAVKGVVAGKNEEKEGINK